MELSWLLGLIHDKDRDEELDEALEEFCESLSQDHKKELKKMLKGIAFRIDLAEAQAITRRMKPFGEHWTMEQVRSVVVEHGVPLEKELHYYLVMNMVYNDYKHTADKFGMDTVEFFFCLAHDFINDPDADEFKVEKYFM